MDSTEDPLRLMRILTDRWTDGFLDETLVAGSCRVQPEIWLNVQRVEGVYFVRRSSLRLLWNYWREIGARNVATKVVSRRRERARNERWLSCGVGRVLEADPPERLEPGTMVVFLAPCHPRCMERVVLPLPLVRESSMNTGRSPGLLELGTRTGMPENLRSLQGWSPLSGLALDEAQVSDALSSVESACGPSRPRERVLDVGTEVQERRLGLARPRRSPGTPQACLVGYGNYAKTLILPNVGSLLHIDHVHEIDPTQIGSRPDPALTWDTSPVLRGDCHPDVVLVAGHHHTHVPVAVDALDRGAAVVIEKPLATTFDQVDDLLAAMDRSRGEVFSCFQRRHLPFARFIRSDLAVSPSEPIDYHCIVYEERLPARHWYRWATSRSRLTSNGCHWIDHFLFLNGFAEVEKKSATVLGRGVVVVHLELVNGAVFSMTLTERGSPRIGLQDHIELRSHDATVRIVNSATYVAERGARLVRRARASRLDAHAAMYKTIALAVRRGDKGDTPRSVEMTARLVLELEDMLDAV